MATYYVTTDTHGYPWGESNVAQAHFDLGDNTPYYPGRFPEIPGNPNGSNLRIRVLGNHDAAYYQQNPDPKPTLNLCDSWTDSGKTICALGFNSAEGQNTYNISSSEIQTAFNYLQNLSNGAHVMVFTHNPLFQPIDTTVNGTTYKTGKSYDLTDRNKWSSWSTSAQVVINMLKAYRSNTSKSFYIGATKYTFTKTGYVIGCFCGHIHNHVQCYDSGLYMESFGTNGSYQWTKDGSIPNAGLYIPPTYTINLDPINYTVNDNSYNNIGDNTTRPILIQHQDSGVAQGTSATGAVTFKANYENYPKFRSSRYIGYSKSPTGGVTSYYDGNGVLKYRNNDNDGYWPVDNITVNGVTNENKSYVSNVKYIRFDVSGRLRYYSKSDTSYESFEEIDNYSSMSTVITFTANGYIWTFKGGLYYGYRSAT